MRGCHNDEASKGQANRFIHFLLADCNRIWNCPADLGVYRKLFIKRRGLEQELHSSQLSQSSHMVKVYTCGAYLQI